MEIGSVWINQTIRNTCAFTKVKKFKRLPLEVNNQGYNISRQGDLSQRWPLTRALHPP